MDSDDLPDSFDAVILGTGLTESVLAAALSRIGHTVLHLDRNPYYGSLEATHSLRNLMNYEKMHASSPPDTSTHEYEADSVCIDISEEKSGTLSNLKYMHYNISEEEKIICESVLKTEQEKVKAASESHLTEEEADEQKCDEDKSEDLNDTHKADSNDAMPVDSENSKSAELQEVETLSPVIMEYVKGQLENPESSDGIEEKLACLLKKSNRFILDISPKLLYSRSEMVDVLITSDTARYCEFRTITRILTPREDNSLQAVPCSRSDIFSSKVLSMIEKRLLMKVLKICIDYQTSQETYKDYMDKPFKEFLKSQKLTENLISYILHAIAMVSQTCPTSKGLERTEKFLKSVGRYGPSPFLWPLYGGEISQAFCRMSAVFGGVYILSRTLTQIHVDSSSNRAVSVRCDQGKLIKTKWLVVNPSYLTKLISPDYSTQISRAILITDRSLSTTGREETVLLSYPAFDKSHDPVRIIELGPTSCVCPRDPPGLRVVHLTMTSISSTAESDLEPYVLKLFSLDKSDDKPRILFGCYFNQSDYGIPPKLTVEQPVNMFVSVGPDANISPDNSVVQAHEIFDKICPGEDFLPRPPDPEDIIFCDDENKTSVSEESFVDEASSQSNDGADSIQEEPAKLEEGLQSENASGESQVKDE